MDSPWQYSIVHNSACKVIEERTLWGQTVCRVWLPNQDAVVRVPHSALRPLSADFQPEIEAGRIAYVAAATKVAEVLEGSTSATDGHVLLAPMESNVIPLPHQIHALSRAISGDRVRYLLADVKWSTESGHRVKAVKCHDEVNDDSRNEKAAKIHGRFQA